MRGIWFGTALLIALAGCGLADYEKRMDEKREQLRLFDEEATLLGDLIDIPAGKDAYGNVIKVPFDIFLRLPKTVSSAFKGAEAIYHGDKQPLFRYTGKTDMNVFIALAKVKDKSPDPKAKPDDEQVLPEDFRARVRKGLIDFVFRTYGVTPTPPEFDKLKADPRKVLRDGREQTIGFESLEFIDPRVQNPSRYYVHFLSSSVRQAAVIYQVPAQQADQSWLRSADVSLKTLDISSAATNLRSAFRSK